MGWRGTGVWGGGGGGAATERESGGWTWRRAGWGGGGEGWWRGLRHNCSITISRTRFVNYEMCSQGQRKDGCEGLSVKQQAHWHSEMGWVLFGVVRLIMTSLVCVPVWVLIALKADGFVSLSKFLSCFHSEACSRWYFRNAVLHYCGYKSLQSECHCLNRVGEGRTLIFFFFFFFRLLLLLFAVCVLLLFFGCCFSCFLLLLLFFVCLLLFLGG